MNTVCLGALCVLGGFSLAVSVRPASLIKLEPRTVEETGPED